MADYRKNLSNAIVGTMTASTSATSIPLQSGYGSTMPAVPFFMTYTPPGQLSTRGNSEIVLVTAVSTDTLTVVRGQKGTTAKDIGTGWIGSAAIYAETSTAIGDIIMTLNTVPQTGRVFMAGQTLNKSDYPLLYDHVLNNSGYGTTTSTTFTLRDMRGRLPIGLAASGTFNALAATGGAELHTNTVSEMAIHTHGNRWRAFMPNGTGSLTLNDRGGDAILISDNAANGGNGDDIGGNPSVVNNNGSSTPWSIMNPYIVINFEVIAN